MKDTRTVLDNVRAKIPAGAKLIVAYIDVNGVVRLSQANCTQDEVVQLGSTISSAGIRVA